MHPVFEYQFYIQNPFLAVEFGPEGFELTAEAKRAIKRAAAAHLQGGDRVTPELLSRVGRHAADLERVLVKRVRDFAAGVRKHEMEGQACPH